MMRKLRAPLVFALLGCLLIALSSMPAAAEEVAAPTTEGARAFIEALMVPGYEDMTLSAFNALITEKADEAGFEPNDLFATASNSIESTDDPLYAFLMNTLAPSSMELDGDPCTVGFVSYLESPADDTQTLDFSDMATIMLYYQAHASEITFISLTYYYIYYELDLDAVTVGERNEAIASVVAQMQAYFDTLDKDAMMSETYPELFQAELDSVCGQQSTDAITLTGTYEESESFGA